MLYLKKTSVKQLVILSLYLAIFSIFGFTFLGYPSIGIVNITLMPLLVIIISMHLGLKGIAFGFVFFGISSFLKPFNSLTPDPFGVSIISTYSIWNWFVISFFSRFLLGIFVFTGFFFLSKRSFFTKFVFVIFATIIGNTFFFLSTVSFYGYESRSLWIWFTLIIPNLVVEWILLPIICFSLSPLVLYLRKSISKRYNW